jgi:hypothetical protein
MAEITIEGIVTPTAWDASQHLAHIAVLEGDTDEYPVDESGHGLELFALIGERVRVSGNWDGDRIAVDRYELVSGDAYGSVPD